MTTNTLALPSEGDEAPSPITVIATDTMTDCLSVQVSNRFGMVSLNLGTCDPEARLYVLMDGSDALRLARALTDAALELVRRDDGGER